MDRTMLFWTLALFFGSSIVFRFIQDSTQDESIWLTLGLEGVVLTIAVAVIVVVVRRNRDSE